MEVRKIKAEKERVFVEKRFELAANRGIQKVQFKNGLFII